MPSYDYHCAANGKTVEVEHKMAEQVKTWGELCRRAGLPLGGTSSKAKVEKLITGGSVVRSAALGSKQERACDTARAVRPSAAAEAAASTPEAVAHCPAFCGSVR